MRKVVYIMFTCVFALGLLSGCGGEFSEEMEAGKDASKALTGAAVSGQAVSGQSIQTDGDSDSPEEGAEQKDSQGFFDNRYCTERYYYRILYDYDENDDRLWYIVQISLETGERRKFRIDDEASLVCVDKDALYYTKLRGDGDEEYYHHYSLWQIPIERHEDGSEGLKTDRAEMVKGLDDIYYAGDDIYVDDTYIVYCGDDNHHPAVFRYERERGGKVRLPVTKEVQKCIKCDIVRIYRKGDCLEIVTTAGIVTWDVRTENVSVCSDKNLPGDPEADDIEFVSTERAWFYIVEEEELDIWRIDMETKKKTEFVSAKELLDMLQTEAGIQEEQAGDAYIVDLYYDENCLYIELEVEYEKEGKTYEPYIILSREDTEGAPLQYEKGLTEYIWNDNGKRDLDMDGEDGMCWSNASLYGISHGMAKVCWKKNEEDEDRIIYDLKTGAARPISWKEEMLFNE